MEYNKMNGSTSAENKRNVSHTVTHVVSPLYDIDTIPYIPNEIPMPKVKDPKQIKIHQPSSMSDPFLYFISSYIEYGSGIFDVEKLTKDNDVYSFFSIDSLIHNLIIKKIIKEVTINDKDFYYGNPKLFAKAKNLVTEKLFEGVVENELKVILWTHEGQ